MNRLLEGVNLRTKITLLNKGTCYLYLFAKLNFCQNKITKTMSENSKLYSIKTIARFFGDKIKGNRKKK